MKKILVIGNGNSIFVRDFISQYSARATSVDLLSLAKAERVPVVKNQVNCDMSKASLFGKLGRFINITSQIASFFSNSSEKYDCIVIHYVNYILFPHMLSIKRKTKNIVTIVYGSDFYRSNWTSDKLKFIIYFMSNKIVFTNPKTSIDFQQKNKNISGNKIAISRFGLPVLNHIDKIMLEKVTNTSMKAMFNLPTDKLIVLVGYSANKLHRHTLVIESIANSVTNLSEKIHLVFHLGYGNCQIENDILESLTNNSIDSYTIINKFYDFGDIAKLRCVTDILINIQPSDQFSGSMQETLYAGGNVIAGDWLPYGELIDIGCKIFTISEPEHIAISLENLINAKLANSSPPTHDVRAFIQGVSSWNANINSWDKILFGNDRNSVEVI